MLALGLRSTFTSAAPHSGLTDISVWGKREHHVRKQVLTIHTVSIIKVEYEHFIRLV